MLTFCVLPYSFLFFFFFTDTTTPEIYTLSLHDALPIFGEQAHLEEPHEIQRRNNDQQPAGALLPVLEEAHRSEEHTSELQSRFDLVCRLLLEKKKMNK